MNIIDAANRSIDKVMVFYERQGVGLGYRPTVSYIPEYARVRDAAAMVRNEGNFNMKVARFQAKHLSKIVFKEECGLNISDEALKESTNAITKRSFKVRESPKTDITLYLPATTIMHIPQFMDGIMAHEVWHLKEDETGVLQQTPFLYEGTPTYAMIRFSEQRVKGTIDYARDLFDLFYVGGAYLIEKVLIDLPNPFPAMLDQGCREPIHAELLSIANQRAAELARKTLQNQGHRKMLAGSMKGIPEFDNIVGRLSHKSMIEAYRKVGAVKISEEIDGQDLGKLIEWFRFGEF